MLIKANRILLFLKYDRGFTPWTPTRHNFITVYRFPTFDAQIILTLQSVIP